MTVQWGPAKAVLLFLGLICKGLAIAEPLPVPCGDLVKGVAGVVWVAFDGAFMWLLQPPVPRNDLSGDAGQEGQQ